MTAPRMVITRIWTIDLKTAERFLSFEKKQEKGVKGTNRKASAEVVNGYAFEMLSGNWYFSHQGFAFIGRMDDGDADFKDGGQRCRALIQACTVGATLGGVSLPPKPDFTFEVMVTEGLDEAAWRVMDIGKRRTVGDILGMDGEVNTFVLASVIQLCWSYDNEPIGATFLRDRWAKVKLSPGMREDYLARNPGLRDAVLEGSRLGKTMTVSSASAGYHLALKAGVAQETVDDFMDRMFSGADMSEKHPVLRLRELLGNARKLKRRLPREDQLALFIKAMNAFAAGREVKALSFRTDSKSRGGAEPFPRYES